MMWHGYFRMAWDSIRSAKWRSLLTMLGVIISVVSVVTIVGLGAGIKQQLIGQIEASGTDLITVRGGNVTKLSGGGLSASDFATVFSRTPLGEKDLKITEQTEGVDYAVPLAQVSGDVSLTDGTTVQNISVLATSDMAAQAFGQSLVSGNFFGPNDTNAATAIVGKNVAEQLFKQNVPIGQSFMFHDRKITVGGVFAPFDFNPLAPGLDYNNAIFIPYGIGSELAGKSLLPYEILVRPTEPTAVAQTAERLKSRVLEAHSNQQDFSVLTSSDAVHLADDMVTLITKLVGVAAVIALVVGGIGIMNILLVSVSERTQEIGIRKSVGATNHQIMGQFLAEAFMLSFVGALLGVVASLLTNYFIRITSSFEPAFEWRIMIGSVVVAVMVGSLFGVAPAIKAARKDPIQALRRF